MHEVAFLATLACIIYTPGYTGIHQAGVHHTEVGIMILLGILTSNLWQSGMHHYMASNR